jgi:hypothetical protein
VTEEIDSLQEVVERLHGCRCTWREAVPVSETFKGKLVWEGTVHVFDLLSHPTAPLCYAWSAPVAGSTKRRTYAVLHSPPVTSPKDAVKAAIVQEVRGA